MLARKISWCKLCRYDRRTWKVQPRPSEVLIHLCLWPSASSVVPIFAVRPEMWRWLSWCGWSEFVCKRAVTAIPRLWSCSIYFLFHRILTWPSLHTRIVHSYNRLWYIHVYVFRHCRARMLVANLSSSVTWPLLYRWVGVSDVVITKTARYFGSRAEVDVSKRSGEAE